MLPLIYHLQIVSFQYAGSWIRNFVIAEHPDHARLVVWDYYKTLHPSSLLDDFIDAVNNADVLFIATLVNNENIHACVLEL